MAEEDPKKPEAWWRNPTTVTILVAIIAAVPPATTAVQGAFQKNSQLEMERSKQTHEIRMKYLEKFLSEKESQRVLKFLVEVEDDPKLHDWADKELNATNKRVSKEDLYSETIVVVAGLANQPGVIEPSSVGYKRFWELYNKDLLTVESPAVESAMVGIGNELKTLENRLPGPALKNLSFALARTMKQELPSALLPPQ